MRYTTLFIGLTREVTFAGLPIMYMVVLIGVSMIGFILTSSFVYIIVVGSTGYIALRALAAYDPKIINVFFATLGCMKMSHAVFSKEGVTYRA